MFRRRTHQPDEKLAAEIQAWAEAKSRRMWRAEPSPLQTQLAGDVADRLNERLGGDMDAADILDLFRVGGSAEPFPDWYAVDVGPDLDEPGERTEVYGSQIFDHLRDEDPAFQPLVQAAKEDKHRREQELNDAADELLAFCRSRRANLETLQWASGSTTHRPGLPSNIVITALRRWGSG